MEQKIYTIELKSTKKFELIDITPEVEEKMYSVGIKNGICVISVPHATAALIVNESEEGVKEDILNQVLALAPEGASYKHDRIDNNARAHVIASILGADKTFIVEKEELVRGTWQNIFLVELDGPRAGRRVVVKVMGK